MDKIDDFVAKNDKRFIEELKDFLRIPSISTSPEHAGDCRAAAGWLVKHLEKLSCTVSLLGSESHPVVWAEGPTAPDRPTVLVYGHYDVQPPDPLELWTSPPFEPTIRDGNLYARGSTDDKGQVFAIIKAFESVLNGGKPPINVRFLIEGQEESGGAVIEAVLKEQPELLQADAMLVADMPYYAPGQPAIYTALRGMCYTEITVRTLKSDLHSGLYGGVAPNAHETLVSLLGKLKSAKGRIQIPGLYDDVVPPTKTERKAWDRLPFKEKRYLRDELGAKRMTGLSGRSVFERIWALPTLEIHGIMGGFTKEGAKTVIPAEATAKVSLRLVPKQKAKKVFKLLKKAVKDAAPDYARVDVRLIHDGDPVMVDVTSAPVQLMSEAFRAVEGKPAVPIRSGGSIPIVLALSRSGAPVILAGIGLPDDGLHAPNEKIAVDQFYKGIRVFGRFFAAMAGRSAENDA